MRILVIQPQLPYPPDRGCYQRNFHLVRQLAARHDVDLLAFDEGGACMRHIEVFQEFCARVRVVPFRHPEWQSFFPQRALSSKPTTIAHWESEDFQQAVDEMVERGGYDFAWVFDIVMAQYLVAEHPELPLALDRSRVDLQFQLSELKTLKLNVKDRILRWENWLKLWRYERRVSQHVRFQTVCGEDDRTFIKRWIAGGADVEVIGNGADLDCFRPEAAPVARADDPTALFCGAMDYSPNADALRWYFSKIHDRVRRKIPNLKILIVGRNPIPDVQAYDKLEGVTVTGEVNDVRPFYRRSWMQIVPLRIGCGTRLKIPESLAMGTPVLSTSIGAQGLDFKPEEEICVADHPLDFSGMMIRMLTSAPFRTSLEEMGLRAVRKRWSWNRFGQELDRAIQRRRNRPTRPAMQPTATQQMCPSPR